MRRIKRDDGDVIGLAEVFGRLGNVAAGSWLTCWVRSKPNSSPSALVASTTPSERKTSRSPGIELEFGLGVTAVGNDTEGQAGFELDLAAIAVGAQVAGVAMVIAPSG